MDDPKPPKESTEKIALDPSPPVQPSVTAAPLQPWVQPMPQTIDPVMLQQMMLMMASAARNQQAPPQVVINHQPAPEQSQEEGRGARRRRVKEEAKTILPGERKATCVECEKMVLYADVPDEADEPYIICSNDCAGSDPKAIHMKCVQAFCCHPENSGYENVCHCTFCGQEFTLDALKENLNLGVNILKSRRFWVTIGVIIVFLCYGYAWKAWAFYEIINRMAPVDTVNNPSLKMVNANGTQVARVPNWDEWRHYNHCVITAHGERILMRRIARSRDDRHAKLSFAEEVSAFYAFIVDGGDEESVDMTKFFSPCGIDGSLWPGVSHWALTLHAWRYGFYCLIPLGLVFGIDAYCCRGGMLSAISAGMIRPRVRRNGRQVDLKPAQRMAMNKRRVITSRR